MNKDGYDNLQDQLINKTAPGRGYDYHAALPVSNPRPEGKTGKSHGLVALARSDRGGQGAVSSRNKKKPGLPARERSHLNPSSLPFLGDAATP
jgi:hypothetical protein